MTQNQSHKNLKQKFRKTQNNSLFVSEDGVPFEEGDSSQALKLQSDEDLNRNNPPHSVEAEQAVLGAILLTPNVLDDLVSILRAEDFYLPAHRFIYTACQALSNMQAPVDAKAISTYLADQGQMENAGGAQYLHLLSGSVISSARYDYYANIVRDKSQLRSLISSCSSIISHCFEPGLESKTMIDEAEQAILEVSERRTERTYKTSAELAQKVFEDIHTRSQHKGMLTGINTGYKSMNAMTGGFQKSDLIILAARPAMGKTAFALNLCLRAAEGTLGHPAVPTAVFSLEMSMDQLVQRLLCARGHVDLSKMRKNQLNDVDWMNLQEAGEAVSKAQIFIDDTPALSIMELRSRARRLKNQHNIGFIIVDYLQLMRASRRIDSRELEISEISRGLKALAKELDIPIIALSQLNRKVEERSDKRPMLSDLRESGAIEQDADMIMFIYREAAYLKHDERPPVDTAEIIFGKHRNGSVGTVLLNYVPSYTQFEEPLAGVQTPYNN